MFRTMLQVVAAAAFLAIATGAGHAAALVATVNLSQQTMTVSKYGRVIYRWPVSTARKGYVTPVGAWRPTRMHKMWYSHKYHMSPMPYSVFYHGGYAVHGTNAVSHLGRPASHGCVRLHTANAKAFYTLVRQLGPGNTKIVVTR